VENMGEGDAKHAPWPFRVDSILGTSIYDKNGNMIYILRLLDDLIQIGHKEFQEPRDKLWHWILTYQIPSAEDPQSSLWVGFFEDMIDLEEVNRNSWCPLEVAKYLIEKQEAVDPNWKTHVDQLFQFAFKYFSAQRPGNVTIMGEQDNDHKPWGGACSKLVGVAAMYGCSGGPSWYAKMAQLTLNWMTYFIDTDGCPAGLNDGASPQRGNWQEDAHTDKIHNLVDGIKALSSCKTKSFKLN